MIVTLMKGTESRELDVEGYAVHASGALELWTHDGTVMLVREWDSAVVTGRPVVEASRPGVHTFVSPPAADPLADLLGAGTCRAQLTGAGGRLEVCGLPESHHLHGGPGMPTSPPEASGAGVQRVDVDG